MSIEKCGNLTVLRSDTVDPRFTITSFSAMTGRNVPFGSFTKNDTLLKLTLGSRQPTKILPSQPADRRGIQRRSWVIGPRPPTPYSTILSTVLGVTHPEADRTPMLTIVTENLDDFMTKLNDERKTFRDSIMDATKAYEQADFLRGMEVFSTDCEDIRGTTLTHGLIEPAKLYARWLIQKEVATINIMNAYSKQRNTA